MSRVFRRAGHTWECHRCAMWEDKDFPYEITLTGPRCLQCVLEAYKPPAPWYWIRAYVREINRLVPQADGDA